MKSAPKPADLPDPREFERRRERREMLDEIEQVETLTKSITARMKRIRLLEEDFEIIPSITARMRKLEMPDDGEGK